MSGAVHRLSAGAARAFPRRRGAGRGRRAYDHAGSGRADVRGGRGGTRGRRALDRAGTGQADARGEQGRGVRHSVGRLPRRRGRAGAGPVVHAVARKARRGRARLRPRHAAARHRAAGGAARAADRAVCAGRAGGAAAGRARQAGAVALLRAHAGVAGGTAGPAGPALRGPRRGALAALRAAVRSGGRGLPLCHGGLRPLRPLAVTPRPRRADGELGRPRHPAGRPARAGSAAHGAHRRRRLRAAVARAGLFCRPAAQMCAGKGAKARRVLVHHRADRRSGGGVSAPLRSAAAAAVLHRKRLRGLSLPGLERHPQLRPAACAAGADVLPALAQPPDARLAPGAAGAGGVAAAGHADGSGQRHPSRRAFAGACLPHRHGRRPLAAAQAARGHAALLCGGNAVRRRGRRAGEARAQAGAARWRPARRPRPRRPAGVAGLLLRLLFYRRPCFPQGTHAVELYHLRLLAQLLRRTGVWLVGLYVGIARAAGWAALPAPAAQRRFGRGRLCPAHPQRRVAPDSARGAGAGAGRDTGDRRRSAAIVWRPCGGGHRLFRAAHAGAACAAGHLAAARAAEGAPPPARLRGHRRGDDQHRPFAERVHRPACRLLWCQP